MQVSQMAETLIGSEIIKLAADIKQKMAAGAEIYNFTIGDFDPQVFPIPQALEQEIIAAYEEKQTNYPPAEGIAELRKAVANFTHKYQGLEFPASSILIGGGARPMIYSVYATLLDPDDTVLFPVPSWNNNHYSHLMRCKTIYLTTSPESNFMPRASDISACISQANLLALCSPLNPTGTVFDKDELAKICEVILAENEQRKLDGRKPVYLLYDQIYWVLTFGTTQHYDPVSLNPKMREYTIFIDGASKCFAATGIRVGWAMGPEPIMNKMKAILSHIGAWSPKAEQIAVANFLNNTEAVENYLQEFKTEIEYRLNGLYEGLTALKTEGYGVDVIAPQAAIYLTVKFDLIGKVTKEGKTLLTTPDVTSYLLEEAGLAVVPFSAFGASVSSPWYRLSVGTCKREDVALALAKLKTALQGLS